MSSLAKRYAQALLDVASQKDVVDHVAGDLHAIHEAVTADEGVLASLSGPQTSQQLRGRLIDKLCEGRHELVGNLVRALHRRHRHGLLVALWPVFEELLRAMRGETVGVVEVAKAVDDGQRHALEALAGSLAGRKVHLTVRETPEILGGVRMKIGNTLYDGSVAYSLERLRRRLNSVPIA